MSHEYISDCFNVVQPEIEWKSNVIVSGARQVSQECVESNKREGAALVQPSLRGRPCQVRVGGKPPPIFGNRPSS